MSARFFSTADAAFETQFTSYLAESVMAQDSKISSVVAGVIGDVRKRGDAALIEYTTKFDRFTPKALRITEKEIADAVAACDPKLVAHLKTAAQRIRDYHEKQKPKAHEEFEDRIGTTLGWRFTPLSSAGLYVPGGLASYFSTVLMNAIPAKIAGVERLVMVTPTPDGQLNPLVLAAAQIAEVDEIYRVGGAQAVAALAYGTKTIRPVDKIVGPGNAYVAEAKRQVFGVVGIDTIAGPSEVLVLADASANPKWVAADLLSQAEHDADARAILVTTEKSLIEAVQQEVESMLKVLPKQKIARKSWEERSACFFARSLDEAVEISNRIAPEHLELIVEQPRKTIHNIRHAGAIFVGAYTPEAIGDYIAGPSHVLPTSGAARFSSGLSVLDFIKRTSIIECRQESFSALAEATEAMAKAESLDAHARSIAIRRNS